MHLGTLLLLLGSEGWESSLKSVPISAAFTGSYKTLSICKSSTRTQKISLRRQNNGWGDYDTMIRCGYRASTLFRLFIQHHGYDSTFFRLSGNLSYGPSLGTQIRLPRG